jgi:hypothetical protein
MPVVSWSYYPRYDNYCSMDKLLLAKQYPNIGKNMRDGRTDIEQIRAEIDKLDANDRRLFYLRYDYNTMNLKSSVYSICHLLDISLKDYIEKMVKIKAHINHINTFIL